MSTSIMSFINIHDDKVGNRMLWDQSTAWIYSAYMGRCVKQYFIMPNMLMAHVKTETSAAWSSCLFASLPQNSLAEVCVLLSITSCCCISSWLQRKSISCFFDAESSIACWLCCAAPWVSPFSWNCFIISGSYFSWKLKCIVPKGSRGICICETLLPLPAVFARRWKQAEWLEGSWCW